ncbi:unnamed protein product [Parnassius apollo]|uniref:(apollo) hypothetical protein n=1 Tax=Parnassius apollo TaxID=110799 RepID=A0A8S3YFY0_PARAO|nr:unnamed protein product [Parnassius apollo]
MCTYYLSQCVHYFEVKTCFKLRCDCTHKRSLTKRPWNLNDIVDALHNIDSDDDLPSEITIFPTEDPNNEITDEDSGDEEFVTLHNLPGSQLRAPAEITYDI